MNFLFRSWNSCAVSVATLCAAGTAWCASATTNRVMLDPYKVNSRIPKVLEDLKRKQVDAMAGVKTFHAFQFQDRIDESGITFEHRMVDDAARDWKPAHYDHGAGIATADVDGDRRLDLYFVNQHGLNQLWRSLGGGRYENITQTAGVGVGDRVCVAAAFADIDNDGKPDLFVTGVRSGSLLFRNLGAGKFENITAKSGISFKGHSSGAVFFDYDRDGLLDLFLTNIGVYTVEKQGRGGFYIAYQDAFHGHLFPQRTEQSILYRNLGEGRFQDVSKETELVNKAWTGDASACDLNEDGYPDLYVMNMQGDDHYYENQDGKRFVEKAAQYFPKTPWGAMGIKCFDYNLDGRMDVLVTDMHSDMTDSQTKDGRDRLDAAFERQKSEPWCSIEWTDAFLQGAANNIFGNALYRNEGNGKFTEVSDQAGAETYWPWGVSAGDLNADGFEDLFVTSGMGYPFRYGINTVLLNDAGQRFWNAEFVLGVEPRKNNAVEVPYFTLDCSGADKEHPLCYHKRGTYTVYGALSSRSSLILDVDDDGDLDIVTNEMIGRPLVLISNLAEQRPIRFVQIQLAMPQTNRDAIGATVRLRAGGKTYVRYNDGKSGYLAQSVLPLYFGLGEANQIDSIEVLWPDGAKQSVTGPLAINKLHRITRE